MLNRNIYVLIGTFLAVIGGIGLFKGFPKQTTTILIIAGVIIALLPSIFKNLAGVTLGVVLP